MGLSDELKCIIKLELRKSFYENYVDWFPWMACDDHAQDFVDVMSRCGDWTMGEYCKVVNNFDQRTPGLFKEEFSSHGIISLNSKTYYCWWNNDDAENKYRSKGLSRKQNQLMREQFVSVLQDKSHISGENRGFRKKDNHLFTYSQQCNGLTYMYGKRRVMADGASTTPLNIQLLLFNFFKPFLYFLLNKSIFLFLFR